MQIHMALQDSTEDTGPSVFNPTPVEHGTKEDTESPAEDGKAKPGNTPGMCVHWPRNSIVTTIAVIVARHSKLAAIKVDRKPMCIQDTAIPWPGVVGVVVRDAEGRRVLLPVGGAQHPTAMVLNHEFIPCLCELFVTVIGWLCLLISLQHLLQEDTWSVGVLVGRCCDARSHFKCKSDQHQNDVHQQQGPAGLNDSNNTKDRQSKECKANKDANPGSSVDFIGFCGFQERVETMGARHNIDTLCCQGNAAHPNDHIPKD